uniref:Uncharacterized protein n=1 Tax=Otus sunia TaxID=257818 RepID=A0A8C8AU41_9STRI
MLFSGSCFTDMKCPGCSKFSAAFSHAQHRVRAALLHQPPGGKLLQLTYGCSLSHGA